MITYTVWKFRKSKITHQKNEIESNLNRADLPGVGTIDMSTTKEGDTRISLVPYTAKVRGVGFSFVKAL